MSKEITEIRTRAGYTPAECLKAFMSALSESGATSTGKAIHFAADLVCSGGYEVWITSIWEFAIQHIGIGSPRIFVYLKKRVPELDLLIARLPEEALFTNEEFQTRICEIIFVIRECPRRTRLSWPRVPPETHKEGWLNTVTSEVTQPEIVRKVYKANSDRVEMYTVACELIKACGEGATEKALFWIKWLIEEDVKRKKDNYGSGLSTLDRGPTKGKPKAEMGFYVLTLFAEAYKDYVGKKLIRMNEEFQALIDLYRGFESRLGGTARKDILALMTQILCEVPRWKVPAAPTLIKDPAVMARAIPQAGMFFKEIVALPKVSLGKTKSIFKSKNITDSTKEKVKHATSMETQMEAYDAAMNIYLNK